MKTEEKKDRFLGSWEAVFLGFVAGWNLGYIISNLTAWVGYFILLCCIVLIINFLTRKRK